MGTSFRSFAGPPQPAAPGMPRQTSKRSRAFHLLQLLFHRKAGSGKASATPLLLEASHLMLFGALWWLVLAITITGELDCGSFRVQGVCVHSHEPPPFSPCWALHMHGRGSAHAWEGICTCMDQSRSKQAWVPVWRARPSRRQCPHACKPCG